MSESDDRGRAFLDEVAARYRHHHANQAADGAAAVDPGAPTGSLVVTGIDDATRERFAIAAKARGMEPGEYLSALVQLHDEMRLLVDRATHPEVDQTLRRLRLGSVAV